MGTTTYSRLDVWPARAVLALAVCAVVAGALLTLSPLAEGRVGKPMRGQGDLALYQAEIDRIRAGEGYYQAAATELVARGYPTRSVFNWRTPLPMWLVGHLPDPSLARGILGLLGLGLMLTTFEALAREPGAGIHRPVGAALLLTGPLMFSVLGNLYVSPILWAGTLVGLSLACYGLNRPGWGVGFGLAAVFFRDLALPYALFSMLWALLHRRWRETFAWTAGLAAWSCFFAWHALQVQQYVEPGATAHEGGWIAWGGAAFVIAIAQVNAYLLLLPQWLTALYLAAALLGFAGWNTPLGRRAGLVACLYLMAFAAVGREFNQYWGALVAPLLCLGVARAPISLRELTRAARYGAGSASRRRASMVSSRSRSVLSE